MPWWKFTFSRLPNVEITSTYFAPIFFNFDQFSEHSCIHSGAIWLYGFQSCAVHSKGLSSLSHKKWKSFQIDPETTDPQMTPMQNCESSDTKQTKYMEISRLPPRLAQPDLHQPRHDHRKARYHFADLFCSFAANASENLGGNAL